MTPVEALIVTLLGMAVVFLGLILCIAGIEAFNRLAQHVTWGGGHGAAPVPVPAQLPAPEAAPEPALKVDPRPMDPHVLAVIAAALEIDYRLYTSARAQRLTLRRPHQA